MYKYQVGWRNVQAVVKGQAKVFSRKEKHLSYITMKFSLGDATDSCP
jgi:hypothetical protein